MINTENFLTGTVGECQNDTEQSIIPLGVQVVTLSPPFFFFFFFYLARSWLFSPCLLTALFVELKLDTPLALSSLLGKDKSIMYSHSHLGRFRRRPVSFQDVGSTASLTMRTNGAVALLWRALPNLRVRSPSLTRWDGARDGHKKTFPSIVPSQWATFRAFGKASYWP